MTKTRLKVLKHYFQNSNNVTFAELLRYFFAPSYKAIAKKYISKIERGEKFDQVYFTGIEEPMFYPKGIHEHSLHLVTVESFIKHNWHYYQIPQTTVTPEDVVVDCGAAEGLFALIVKNKCKKIYLIEPLKKFVESLHQTFKNSKNVEILPFAVSDREFTSYITSNDISSALTDKEGGEKITVTTLDRLFLEKNERITYLKMDLEGHDFNALVGAEQLIRKYKPKIAITTYHHKDHATQMEQFLKSIVPEYTILCKGIYQETGSPVMLHAWINN